jgi:hypothetical protein
VACKGANVVARVIGLDAVDVRVDQRDAGPRDLVAQVRDQPPVVELIRVAVSGQRGVAVGAILRQQEALLVVHQHGQERAAAHVEAIAVRRRVVGPVEREVEPVVAGQTPDEARAQLPGGLHRRIERLGIETEVVMEKPDDLRERGFADANDGNVGSGDHLDLAAGQVTVERERRQVTRGATAEHADRPGCSRVSAVVDQGYRCITPAAIGDCPRYDRRVARSICSRISTLSTSVSRSHR